MNSPKNIIDVEHVFHKYNNNGKGEFVLNDINLHIPSGEFLTLVGITGSGKSTLLKIILGAEKPSNGEVFMDGKEITRPNRDIGIVFQKYSLFENRTVRENISLGLQLEHFNLYQSIINTFYKNQTSKEFIKKTDQYLDKIGLMDHADKYPYQLSGGMKQRVAIAQALIMEHRVLLMDEPFGSLDVGTREEMQIFILEQWKRTKQTIIFVTHDLEEALFLGTRIIILSPYSESKSELGSKIIKDIPIPWQHPRTTKIKHSKEFNLLMESIRHEGLDPKSLKNINDFNSLYPT